MYYSGIKWYDVNDGPGVRVGLYVSGCSNHCKGCFQSKTWNPKNGEEFDRKIQLKIFDQMKNDFITGITVLGGDPFYPSNVIPVTKFLKEVQERFTNKSIWAYTGYYYEGSYNPSFYTASTESYTFTYNYTYNRTDTLPKYYSYYRLDSSTEREAPNGQYAWNYVEKYGEKPVYATTIRYQEPVYSSLSYGVSSYKITGYTVTAYRTNYAYRTEYNGARTNYKQYIDRFHRVDVYRQDLVLQRSYYYTY